MLVGLIVCVGLGSVLDGASDEIADMGIGKRIKNVLTGASAGDDSLRAKEPKLLRDGRQPDPRGFCELGHAPFAVAQSVQKLKPREIPCGPKNRRSPLELLVADEVETGPPGMLFRPANIVALRAYPGVGSTR